MMPSAVLSKVNSTISRGLQRVIRRQQAAYRNSIHLVSIQGDIFSGSSRVSFYLPYLSQCLSRTCCFSPGSQSKRNSMAAFGSSPFIGDVYIDDVFLSCGNHGDFTKPGTAFFNNKGENSCRKASLRLTWQEKSRLVSPQFMCNVSQSCNSKSFVAPWMKNFHTMSSVCYAARAAHDVSFDGNSHNEQLEKATTPADRTILGNRTLKLVSGACYLPHPDKEETGGEDAHFICDEEQTIGVADGVGGWADVGINAGFYARELMSNSLTAIQQEPKGSIDPTRVLEKAHSRTKAKGSSTACIIALDGGNIHAINLGDSGFIVVRDGCTVFQSPPQQHGFNFTYQLESGPDSDLPSSGEVFKVPVAPGDVIVTGTDGLFDNLYNNEITAVVVHAIRAGLSPQATAQKIAALARQRALDRNRQTPFSTAAQEAGFRYFGGKLDDTTVVVSFVSGLVTL